MSRNPVLRFLESFFRRWWLYLIPLALLTGVGAMSVLHSKPTYQAGGTINVASSTLLSTLSNVNDNTNFGFDTPAAATSKQLNALLQTDQFVNGIISAAGLQSQVASGEITPAKIRSSVGSAPTGSNLVKVSAVSDQPLLPPKLVSATIDRFTAAVVDSQVSDSTAAQSFYSALATQYQGDVNQARSAVDAYLVAHPAPTPPLVRPDSEQLDVTRLQGDLTQAQDRYNGALDKSLSAQLSIEQAKADVGQRLRLVDPPDTSFRQSRLKKSIMSFATFVALGILLMIGTVVVGTILDQSVRSASDVRDRLGLRVLGVVPVAAMAGGGAAVAAKAREDKGKDKAKAKSKSKRKAAPLDDEPVVVPGPVVRSRELATVAAPAVDEPVEAARVSEAPLAEVGDATLTTEVEDEVVEEPVAVADDDEGVVEDEVVEEPVAVVDDDEGVVEDEVVEEPVAVADDDEGVVEDEVVEEPVAVADDDEGVVEDEVVEEPVAVADDDEGVVDDEPVDDEVVEPEPAEEPEPARQAPVDPVPVASVNGNGNGNANGHARDPRLTKRRSRFYLGSTRR